MSRARRLHEPGDSVQEKLEPWQPWCFAHGAARQGLGLRVLRLGLLCP